MEDKEKSLEQLSGRVTESQKNYLNNEMEGSFSDKIAELIESYKTRVKDNDFNVDANKTAINQALNVIVKNMETIEINAKNYVQDIKSDIEVRVNALEEDSTEFNDIKTKNEELEINNIALTNSFLVMKTKYEELEQKSLEDIEAANVKYDKLKVAYENLDQDYMKSRLQFGDIKDDLTQKNINSIDKYNKLKEDHTSEINKLKEDANKMKMDLAKDYAGLSIEKNQIDKELAVANSVIESKNDLVRRLEESQSSDKKHLENVIGPMAVYYSRRNRDLEAILETNNISYPKNNFQDGGREEIIEEKRKTKSIKDK